MITIRPYSLLSLLPALPSYLTLRSLTYRSSEDSKRIKGKEEKKTIYDEFPCNYVFVNLFIYISLRKSLIFIFPLYRLKIL